MFINSRIGLISIFIYFVYIISNSVGVRHGPCIIIVWLPCFHNSSIRIHLFLDNGSCINCFNIQSALQFALTNVSWAFKWTKIHKCKINFCHWKPFIIYLTNREKLHCISLLAFLLLTRKRTFVSFCAFVKDICSAFIILNNGLIFSYSI